ncbi:MAG: NAD(P)-binding protein, partial [Leptospirales bacterium]
MKVGVIGSGLAGLSACWYASKFARVDILEKEAGVGIDAHSVDARFEGGRRVRIDTPLRVLKAGYYPGLLRLYEASRIPTEIIDYSGSFCDAGRAPYFRYRNLIVGEKSYAFITNAFSLARPGRRILRDIFRFYGSGRKHLRGPETRSMNFGEYLEAFGYSEEFRDRFILPLFAAINTCGYAAVKEYPAATLVDYLVNSRNPSGVRRISGGVANVAQTLSRAAEDIQCAAAVHQIEQKDHRVVVSTSAGRFVYDYVVISTQANQAARFCERSLPRHRDLLSRFRYEKSELVVHKDLNFMPRTRSAWSPVNFIVDPAFQKPMVTIYMNAIQRELRSEEAILQTWNPHSLPAPDLTLAHSAFE